MRALATSTRTSRPLAPTPFDDRGVELLVRMAVSAERARQLASEGDRVTLDHHVEIEALLAEQHVAHGAADQVHAVVLRRDA